MFEKENSHITTGLRKILEFSLVYNFWQLITGSEKAKKKIILEYVSPFPKAKILDIGCGTGAMINYINEKLDIDYVGYDINEKYIEFAKNKHPNKGRFYCTSVSEAKLIERNFDIVAALAIVHHLNLNESENLFKLAKQSLKPGGYFLLAEPVWTDSQSRFEKYLMSKDRGQNIRTEKQYLEMAKKEFSNVECQIVPGLFSIPWTTCILKCGN